MPRPRPHPIAVIDIGSNSGRVVVYRVDRVGALRIVASARAALRLVSDVDEYKKLTAESMDRALEALQDFSAVAQGAGARRMLAVATAAIRDASNGDAFIARVRRRLGISIRIIDGKAEGRYGFHGALHGLPVESGRMFDMGGGSLQISSFRARRLNEAVSLKLGALRLSNRFLEHDPPRHDEVRRLVKHVRGELHDAGVSRLRRGDRLVGTGGTVRNLAKIDARGSEFPVDRVHGYVLSQSALAEIAERLTATRSRRRDSIPGLSDDRADSIVGGALGIATLMEEVGAAQLVVSGQGVREGLALSLLAPHPASIEAVRRTSLRSLGGRFDTWNEPSAERRRGLATSLYGALAPRGRRDHVEALAHAAYLLDTGRSMDFFNRHGHTADILMAAEMDGFAQREVALAAAVTRLAWDPRWDPHVWWPLIDDEAGALERAAVVLLLADEIEQRCRGERAITARCHLSRTAAFVRVPALGGWRETKLEARFRKIFGRRLVVN